MAKILQSELLKLKRLGTFKFLIIIPFITVLIAYLMVGLQIFVSFSIYWWEAIFLYLLISLLCLFDRRLEDQAGHFQNVIKQPFSWKITLIKMALIALRTLIASLFFLAFISLVAFLYTGLIPINLARTTLALLLIWVTTLWNIPFSYLLTKYMNHFLMLALNSLICLLIAPLLAQSSFWFVFPYTYHYKISQFLLNLKPSGDLSTGPLHTNLFSVLATILLAISLTLLVSYLLKKRSSNAKK